MQPDEQTFGPSIRILAGHATALCLGLLLMMPVASVDHGPFLPDEGPLNVLPGRAFGIWGMTALAVVASAGASLVAGLTARRIEPRASILVIWLCGLGTPLFFNAFGLHGHTIDGLCAAMVALAVVRDLVAGWWEWGNLHRWAFAEPDDLAGLIGLGESTQVRHLVVVTSSEHQIDSDEAWEGWQLSGPTSLPRYRFPLEMWETTR